MSLPDKSEENSTEFQLRMMNYLGKVFPSVILASTLPSAIKFATKDYEGIKSENFELRKKWLISHGFSFHGGRLYELNWNSGELKCESCGIDFKNSSIDDIETRLFHLSMERV
jgi:hypothetical protein